MRSTLSRAFEPDRSLRGLALAIALGVVVGWLVLAPGALSAAADTSSAASTTPAKPAVSATLEGCVTAAEPEERAVTFAGEMATIPGSAKMEMRIDVLERMPRELVFHSVAAPGLGVWRTSAPGVKTYKYLKEITNLAAPAYYRAVVRFRWLNAKGHTIKSLEARTPRCTQTAPQSEVPKRSEEATSPS
jgi:hypothetical protein